MNRTVGLVFVAVLSITTLAVTAATFDAVNRPAPDSSAPDADLDASDGSPSNASTVNAAGSFGGLASPFEWRADRGSGGSDVDGGGNAVPVALALLVVCAVGFVALLTGSDHDAIEQTGEEEQAGSTIDSPERPRWPVDADENAVYRSWQSLADRLDAAPTRSPAEIAAGARDRGLDAGRVTELTAAFREVRYGGRPATPEREARATDAVDGLDAEDDT